MPIDVRVLGARDSAVLDRVAPDVFDFDVDARWTREFLADARHHLAVAVDGEQVVGMASGVHYVHPDKAPQLFINEVGVAATHHGQGIGRRLVHTLLEHARAIGCVEAWVLTSRTNPAAERMYRAAGAVEADEQPVMYEFRLDQPLDASGSVAHASQSRTAGDRNDEE